jgi:patatin-related protein
MFNEKQLRLGLVCYGGVSLAIYMHGITREIHKIVRASAAFIHDPENNPFDPDKDSASVYWEFFKDLAAKNNDVRTRVLVDVISGTSAGGINGVALARCLAHDMSQNSLRDVWMDRGNIFGLLANRLTPHILRKTGNWLHNLISGWTGRQKPSPPYRDYMFGWLYEALKTMEHLGKSDDSLMPKGHELELFVTMTDYNGYEIPVPALHPAGITDHRYRHVMRFAYDASENIDHFNGRYVNMLAFAARATSCFPVAFPPIRLENIYCDSQKDWIPLPDAVSEFFREHQMAGVDVEKTPFVDGGILDNKPFGHCIEAVIRRPAATEVERKILFIEPHPQSVGKKEKAEAGNNLWDHISGYVKEKASAGVQAIKESFGLPVSQIQAHETIYEDLLQVQAFNERVRMINEIIEKHYQGIEAEILAEPDAEKVLSGKSKYDVDAMRDRMHVKAMDRFGMGYGTYVRVKLNRVAETFARVVNQLCNYPENSGYAVFVRNVIHEWANGQGLFTKEIRPTPRQVAFLKVYDLGYTLRRISFVIQGVNTLYTKLGPEQTGKRKKVDDLKAMMYGMIRRIRRVMAGGVIPEDLKQVTCKIFSKDRIRTCLDKGACAGDFLNSYLDLVNGVEVLIAGHIQKHLAGFGEEFLQRSHQHVARWPRDEIKMLLLRYLGFPFWDALIYPYCIIGNVGELQEINVFRISPNDAAMLEAGGAEAKLKGVSLGHFNAFTRLEYRENDYLWGRLDAAERMLMLIGGIDAKGFIKKSMLKILAEEDQELKKSRPLISSLRSRALLP